MRHSPVLALVTLVVLGGCGGADLTARVPTLAGGATYQQDLDSCQQAVPPGTSQRAERFAGCMVAAGHGAWVEVATGEEFLVRQTQPHARQAAEADVVDCYKLAKEEATFRSCLTPRGYTIQRFDSRYRR
jgi:hypothetical protein